MAMDKKILTPICLKTAILCCQQPVLFCIFNMTLKFTISNFFLFFALKGDNVLTKEQNQSYEPNKLVKVKVSAAIMFLAR